MSTTEENITDEILKEWDEDSKFDRNKLDLESFRTTELMSKYLGIQTEVHKALVRLEKRHDTLRMKKKLWMDGKLSKEDIDALGWSYSPLGGIKVLKSDLDSYVRVDEDVQTLSTQIEDMKNCHNVVLSLVDNLKYRNKAIENAINWQKFQAGA